MTVDVRTISEDEFEAYTVTTNLGFNSHPFENEAELRRGGIDFDRAHAAFDGDAMVGTARSFRTELTLPGGGQVPVGAVTNVVVTPTHRRRGVLTEMMTAQLDDIAQRGEPAAILIASEAPIYGRFGYGCATRSAGLKLGTGRARFIARPAEVDDVRVVDKETGRKHAPLVYDRYRLAQPGAIERNDRWWDFHFGVIRHPRDEGLDKRFEVLCGEDGWLSYEIKDDWQRRLPNQTIEIHDMVAATPGAYAALWYYCLTLDWIATVSSGDRPVAEPLGELLTDPRRAELSSVNDFLWARLLDVPAALSARTYSRDGRVVFEVVDTFRPDQAGRYRIEDGACVRTDESPELTLTARDLGAAWLGGTGLWLAADVGRVDEHTAGAVARFDDLFVTPRPPWCNTWF